MASKHPQGGRREGTKNMVLRLDPDLAEQLQLVAEAEGRSVSEAIAEAVERRRGDDRFIRLLEENLRRHQRLLELLRDRDGGR
jgi:predicted transcriptional regulator